MFVGVRQCVVNTLNTEDSLHRGSTVNCHLDTLCLKNDTALACYNFDVRQPILIIFGGNVAK